MGCSQSALLLDEVKFSVMMAVSPIKKFEPPNNGWLKHFSYLNLILYTFFILYG